MIRAEQLQPHPSRAVRASAYRHAMRFGGVDAFPVVSDIVASSKDKLLRAAAMRAPLELPKWSPEVAAAVCPWARDHLRIEGKRLASWPPKMVARCSDDYAQDMFKEVARRLEAKTLTRPLVQGLAATCAPPERRKASPKLCDTSRRLLTRVAETEATAPRDRAFALQALGQQWPDAQTSTLAKKLSKVASPHLKHTSRKVLEHIERTMLSGDKTPGKAAPSKKKASPKK